MKEICIDANIAIKIAIPADLSFEAKALFNDSAKKGFILIAPAIFEVETDSVIRWLLVNKHLSKEGALLAFNTLDVLPITIMIHPKLRQRAREIAELAGQGRVYDSSYAALADLRGCEFWTADKKFFNAVKNRLSFVKYLGNYKGM
ncbi:hypothetical protein A2483_03730 [Candidatus Peregrinibacteria bacterium RIFOXYC2_FULL_33_13]|nr:MAG: hypothetical protein UR30_C0008G0090 [Candidatus Peregrinibacteria bacterium GW2011_GWC2_33_13]OGJ54172.1 MAG: hypothetical protein A2483_03730 [Candidatus Peregrinibacteria bacterium RIFOXYC2_FULL_33_13]